MKRYSVYPLAAMLLGLVAWAGCNVDRGPVSPTAQSAGPAAKPAGKGTLPDEALQGPRSVVLSDGRVAERRVHIFFRTDYKKGFHHRPDHGGGPGGGGGGNGGGGDEGGSSCFAYLGKGVKWKTVESWVMNTQNAAGLDEAFVFDNIGIDIAKWEDAADGAMDGSAGADILGNGSTTTNALVADTESPDGQNEVYFADIGTEGAIGVTIVWGIFSGPPFQRELLEWDQIYDDVDFGWSSSGEAGKMDFENIATHEIGHAVGMGHPDDTCTEETMYRFADFGETKKRTLEAGDIAGVDGLY